MGILRRALMGVVGLAILVVYAMAAFGGYLLLSWLFAAPPDLGVAAALLLVVSLVGGYLSYRFGTARLLTDLGAAELPRQRAPTVHRTLDRLSHQMAVESPQLLVGNLGAPNALSVGGPRGSAIVLDQRVLGLLTPDELAGILAHELAHVERRDAFLQTLVVNAVQTLAGLLFVLLLPLTLLAMGLTRAWAWLAGHPAQEPRGLPGVVLLGAQVLVGVLLSVFTLAVLAYSRHREFAADERAAEVTGRPAALARGLVKIHDAARPEVRLESLLTISGEDEDDGVYRLLSTHPPVEDRVDRLLEDRQWRTSPRRLGRR
ncbi:M48 family metallopeptidase [Halobacteriales archaeon Cl-PHB]